MTKEAGDTAHKQRIYSSYTRDFKVFTSPEKYIEREHHVIDTTIVEENGVFYRFSKDETTKKVRMDRGTESSGGIYRDGGRGIKCFDGSGRPCGIPHGGRRKMVPYGGSFAEGLGYLPLICTSLEKGDFKVAEPGDCHMGNVCKRHGSVLVLEEEEYERLHTCFGNRVSDRAVTE